ncbi:neutral/alkaline non-lysosomal ceramidase N-terminal domain-containing protein [Nibrella saemangeumensis]|uniref:Neutral/alkaline non-lysosomal ceramidase N-terminal domain-containing protein n=1 Tax=Nibrella saemangeumensis TaxID=1084526 RepID=A0ABP8MS84_9BACT
MRTIDRLLLLIFLSLTLVAGGYPVLAGTATGWRAGVARVVITPEQPMWLAGYAARTHPSEGKLHDLWAKALVLEDADGKKAVLITTDLVGVPLTVSNYIRDRLQARYGLTRAQILLNSSHTHSGPVLQNALSDIYPLDQEQLMRIKAYTEKFQQEVVALVGRALQHLEPVELYSQNGVTRFQVNRRNNAEGTLARLIELKGPNDYAVPVLKVVNGKGELKAIAFGYACHPTVLDLYQWSGDYPGYAQLELEKAHPGVTALFFQGAGADQNPLPRRTIPLAHQYGRELAAAVERVLAEEMRKLSPRLTTAYQEVNLPLTGPPTREELVRLTQEAPYDYMKRWAGRMLQNLDKGEKAPASYPYPLQVWQLGEQTVMSLGGELVVHYANELKRLFGPELFVLGYSNNVMAYIPSATILKEGGYEGATSQMVYGLPGPWGPAVESLILGEMVKLAGQVGVSQLKAEK